ncbi:hypothetical protein PspLS_00971 [Pyricularia sp. CBS 133598]|nr:hypothetical protein PspLS_00971 [Pyricularia sp. CBS 133598]
MDAQEPQSVIDAQGTRRLESDSGPGLVSNVESTADFSIFGNKAAVSTAKVQNWQSVQSGTMEWSPLELGKDKEREQKLKAFLQDIDRVIRETALQASVQDGNGNGVISREENTQASAPQTRQADIALRGFGGAGSCTELPN